MKLDPTSIKNDDLKLPVPLGLTTFNIKKKK
jgi:hypothetical protein